MKVSLNPKYKCCKCGDVHNDADDAEDCCRPLIIEVWACPLCREEHSDEREALSCCDYDPDGPLPPPTAAELEAMGQIRLLP